MKILVPKKNRLAYLMPIIMALSFNNANALNVPAGIQAYLNSATVTEFGYPSGTEQERQDFKNWLTANWIEILAEIDAVASEERKQRIITAGAEFLAGPKYIEFLARLMTQFEAGKVTKSVVIDAMSPGGQKYGFLAFNFQHPSVRTLCNRAKTLFPEDPEFQSLMTNILSGAQGKQAGAALAMENRPEPEIIPLPN